MSVKVRQRLLSFKHQQQQDIKPTNLLKIDFNHQLICVRSVVSSLKNLRGVSGADVM